MSFRKNYWGYLIPAVFVGFATLMISFAVVASRHKSTLVVTDYYKAELGYQKRIEKINNYNALQQKPVIEYDALERGLAVHWPEGDKFAECKGKINFYKPNNAEQDFQVEIKPGTGKNILIANPKLVKGMWIVKMEWESKGMGFYTEKSIIAE